MRSLLAFVALVTAGCAPSVFIKRPLPPSVTLPEGTRTVQLERRSTGSAIVDLIEAFSFADPNRTLHDAAIDSLASALSAAGFTPLVSCSPPCAEAHVVVTVAAALPTGSLSVSRAHVELDLDVRRRDGTEVAHRVWSGEGTAVASDEPAALLVERALAAAAGAFTSSLEPSELSVGYRLATGQGLDTGNERLSSGDAAAAIVEYRKVLTGADAHYNLAVALTAAGDDEAAFQEISEAARLSPAWYAHRVAEFERRRPPRAP